MVRRGAAAWILAALLAAGCRPRSSSYVFLWCADADRKESDFLAVVDVRPDSASYGRVVASLPVGAKGTVQIDREGWPHGPSGKAVPHGAVFSLE